jgi:Zn-dependent peptidase ImmA (M78 family)/transcriptional regulator with XRE-family HTH domain
MNAINPEMIVLAREARGYTQSELAELIGIKQGTLSKIEKGFQPPSDEVLMLLVDKLLYPVTFFEQRDNVYNPDLLYYRKRIVIKKKVLLKAEATMNIIRMNMERLLSSVELPDVNLPQWDVEEHGTPEDAARFVRQNWKMTKGKIENLTKVVEDNGIIVIPFDFGSEKMDGLSMYTKDGHPIIFINSKMPGDRQRLTLAHELAHLVMHLGRVISQERNVEHEAMRFAAELLVPEKEFINSVDGFDLQALANQKRYWLVSMGAILVRGKVLNLITENQYRYVWQQMAMLGYKTKEPAELTVAKEKATLIKEILEMHIHELGYSKEEISEMLNISFSDLQELYYYDNLKLRIIKN